jgi:hypothetical protein
MEMLAALLATMRIVVKDIDKGHQSIDPGTDGESSSEDDVVAVQEPRRSEIP